MQLFRTMSYNSNSGYKQQIFLLQQTAVNQICIINCKIIKNGQKTTMNFIILVVIYSIFPEFHTDSFFFKI